MASSSGLWHRDRSEFPEVDASPDEKPVDVRGMADYLGVSEYSVRVYANSGEIPSFKLGGQFRFYISEVRAHLTRPRDPWEQSPQSRGRRRKP